MASGKGSPMAGDSLTDIPWEDRPEGEKDIVWRSTKNPIIPRDVLPDGNSVSHGAVTFFAGGFVGVFRCDDSCRRSNLHVGHSVDGYQWTFDEEPIRFESESEGVLAADCGYDPRVCWIENRCYLTWCIEQEGRPTIGIAHTDDFKSFHRHENAFAPFVQNSVLFPRKIGGRYAMLNRPTGPEEKRLSDIYYCESPDMTYWGKHRRVMGRVWSWGPQLIGPGPIPIETQEGWLLIYHGALRSCGGLHYSMGVALLDLEEPWKVIRRPGPYIMSAQALYELTGNTPNVVYPCSALCDASTGRLAVYYGAADTVVCLAHGYVQDLLTFAKESPQLRIG
jgi:beta-1,4-mannooligosaccharide/beta-1,4-mannosyl-N-acetylglucosamine phosphorylase